MRHTLWIVAIVGMAACGGGGGSPEPTATETQPLKSAQVLSRDSAHLQVVNGPKGQKLHLGGTFRSAAMARVGADGQLQTECFDEAAPADAFLAGTPSARTAEVR
jgi:hypothetical protein